MQQLTWSPIRQNPVTELVAVRQNPVTELVAVCQNPATDWIFPSELLHFDKRRPTQSLDFDESATTRIAAFFREHIDLISTYFIILLYFEYYELLIISKASSCLVSEVKIVKIYKFKKSGTLKIYFEFFNCKK